LKGLLYATYPIHFVRDIAQHDRGADVRAVENTVTTDTHSRRLRLLSTE
jgi:hypothetical protein